MDSENITKERIDYTIDLLVTMTVEELAEETGKDANEVLPDFITSRTGRALYDVSTGLWHNGPSYLADMYLESKNC